MDVSDVAATLRAETHGHPPCVAGFCTEQSAQSRGIGYEEGKSPTLRAGVVPAAVFENHSQDSRYTGPLDVAQTVSSTFGNGGNNQPFVVETPKTLKIRSGCEGGGKGALIQEDKSATLTEYLLAKGERSAMRFYSLSAEIQTEKDAYYDAIERAQRGTLDVTRWIRWFLCCHRRAVGTAEVRLGSILAKAEFWNAHASDELTVNQRAMLNRLFDGFKGNLTSSKWAKICKVSQDTASREINALVAKGILRREGQGRSTHYALA